MTGQTLSPFWSWVVLVGLLAVIGLLDWLAVWHVRREDRPRDQRSARDTR